MGAANRDKTDLLLPPTPRSLLSVLGDIKDEGCISASPPGRQASNDEVARNIAKQNLIRNLF